MKQVNKNVLLVDKTQLTIPVSQPETMEEVISAAGGNEKLLDRILKWSTGATYQKSLNALVKTVNTVTKVEQKEEEAVGKYVSRATGNKPDVLAKVQEALNAAPITQSVAGKAAAAPKAKAASAYFRALATSYLSGDKKDKLPAILKATATYGVFTPVPGKAADDAENVNALGKILQAHSEAQTAALEKAA